MGGIQDGFLADNSERGIMSRVRSMVIHTHNVHPE